MSIKAVVFNSMNYLYSVLKLFFFSDTTKNIKLPQFSSDNLPATVGGTVGASVIVAIGVVFAMFVARYDTEMNASAEKNTTILIRCFKHIIIH